MLENNNKGLIWIPFNVPSLKNSKIKTKRGVFSSVTVKNYLRLLGIQHYSTREKIVKGYVKRENIFESLRPLFEEKLKDLKPPFKFHFHLVRKTKVKCDFNNITQIIADLLVAHNIIEDDNMDYFLPYPLFIEERPYSIDKDNPGVYIDIT